VRSVALALGLTLLVGPEAHADPSETFRFSWTRGEGAGSCPDARALAARAAERLGRNPFSDGAEQSIEGSVLRVGERFHAELFVRDAMGIARGARELSAGGADCRELADAVVLAVVLAIDPNAALSGVPAPPPAPAPLPAPAAETPPVVEPPRLEACPVVRCPPSEPRPSATSSLPPRRPHASVVGRGVLATGVLPGDALGAGVFGEVGRERLRAALGMRYFPEVTTGEGRFGFGMTVGTAGLVAAVRLTREFELSLLAELEAGALHAVVYELEPVEPGDRLWVAAAAGARFGFSGLSPLRVELGASLVVPFVRPVFEVRGTPEPVFQSAPVGGLFYLGLGFGTL